MGAPDWKYYASVTAPELPEYPARRAMRPAASHDALPATRLWRPAPAVRVSRKKGLHAVLAVAILFILGLAVVGQSSLVAARGYELYQVEKQIAEVKAANERLELEVARLHSAERVAQVAETRLGMVRPAEGNVVYLAVAGEAPPDTAASTVPEAQLSAARQASLFDALVALLEKWAGEAREARAAGGGY